MTLLLNLLLMKNLWKLGMELLTVKINLNITAGGCIIQIWQSMIKKRHSCEVPNPKTGLAMLRMVARSIRSH